MVFRGAGQKRLGPEISVFSDVSVRFLTSEGGAGPSGLVGFGEGCSRIALVRAAPRPGALTETAKGVIAPTDLAQGDRGVNRTYFTKRAGATLVIRGAKASLRLISSLGTNQGRGVSEMCPKAARFGAKGRPQARLRPKEVSGRRTTQNGDGRKEVSRRLHGI